MKNCQKYKRYTTVFSLLLIPLAAKAQTPPAPITFDVDRAVQEAIGSSSQIRSAQRNLGIDSDRANQTIAQGKPNITATGRATQFDAITKVKIGGGPAVTVLQDHTEELALTATQRLDITGQIRAAVNQNRLQRLADTFLLTQLTNARTLQARTIYYNYLRAHHQVQVARAALKAAIDQESTARKLYEGQIGQKIDLLSASTRVASAQQDVTRAQNNEDIARANFNDLVGRPLDTPLDARDVEGVTVGEDVVPASVPVGTPAPNQAGRLYPSPAPEVETINLSDSLQEAQQNRPEIRQAQANVRAAELGIKLARAGQEVGLSLSASGNYYPTPSLQDPRQKTASVSAAITIPLYDGGLTRGRINEARGRRDNAQTSLESAQSDVALDVRTAYLNLYTAARQIASANAALEQAVAARQLAQVRYENQVGLYLEISDAQNALVRAQSNQVDAVYTYLIAKAQFDNSLGRSPKIANSSASGGRASSSGNSGTNSPNTMPGNNSVPQANPANPTANPTNPANPNPTVPSANPKPGNPPANPSNPPTNPANPPTAPAVPTTPVVPTVPPQPNPPANPNNPPANPSNPPTAPTTNPQETK